MELGRCHRTHCQQMYQTIQRLLHQQGIRHHGQVPPVPRSGFQRPGGTVVRCGETAAVAATCGMRDLAAGLCLTRAMYYSWRNSCDYRDRYTASRLSMLQPFHYTTQWQVHRSSLGSARARPGLLTDALVWSESCETGEADRARDAPQTRMQCSQLQLSTVKLHVAKSNPRSKIS